MSRIYSRYINKGAKLRFLKVPDSYKDVDEYFSQPESVGLGIEVNESAVIEFSQNPSKQFTWPDNRLADGSIADY